MKRSKAANQSRKAAEKKRTKPDDKGAVTTFVPPAIPEVAAIPVPATTELKPAAVEQLKAKTAASSRSEAARRTAQGKTTTL